MKTNFIGCLMLFLVCAAPLSFAEDNPKKMHENTEDLFSSRSLKDSVLVYETDQNSAQDSLERISGHYDLGFSAPSQTYKSKARKKGPFAEDSPPEKLE